MICLVFALAAEAKPFLKAFSLSLISDTPFRIYQNNHVTALVTGIGKESMTRALSYFSGLFASHTKNFFNIGLAGHREKEIGKPFLCHKIRDLSSGKRYYPTLFFPWKEPTMTLCTIDHIESNYPSEMLYDQEGSAFFETARTFTELERIQLIKVVSDNRKNPPNEWNKQKASNLMEMALPYTKQLISHFE